MLAGALPVSVPDGLRALVAGGHLGRKSGHGFYRWQDGRATRPDSVNRRAPDARVTERLLLRLLNEAVACLREGVVADADLLDAGLIFGAGFPPFLGGPLHYGASRGLAGLRADLARLEDEFGTRFHPDPGWDHPALSAHGGAR